MDIMIYIYVTIIRFDHIDDFAGPYIKYIDKRIIIRLNKIKTKYLILITSNAEFSLFSRTFV